MKKLLVLILVFTSTLAVLGQQKKLQYRTKEEKLNEEYCSGMFKTIEGTYFDMLNDNAATSAGGYLNILDWLQGRVAGLQIYKTRDDDRLAFIRGSRAGIYVDEMPMDPGFLNVLPVTDIAMIKIIKGPFVGGFNSPGGVIAIYTICADDEDGE